MVERRKKRPSLQALIPEGAFVRGMVFTLVPRHGLHLVTLVLSSAFVRGMVFIPFFSVFFITKNAGVANKLFNFGGCYPQAMSRDVHSFPGSLANPRTIRCQHCLPDTALIPNHPVASRCAVLRQPLASDPSPSPFWHLPPVHFHNRLHF
ncbi:unnamed protein product [Polarella glacialis]|uniref:Transmembrane protein n=1 Tax=Polarella glacialis TaxID=89957 RepID=A0A813KWH8_POLGL|nr:unnamed protein product [Polarella glacialis]